MAIAAPLGAVKSYKWQHAGRPDALLFLEQEFPFRINFQTFDENVQMRTESGWHGTHGKNTCTEDIVVKTRCRPRGFLAAQKGDVRITLDGFRYLGMDAEWTHNSVIIEKKVNEDYFRLKECSCGTRHRVTMFECEAIVPWELTPGMTYHDGYSFPSTPPIADASDWL